MIKTNSEKTSLNAGFLESLRDLSENLSKEEVKELFRDSAEDLYNNNLFTSTKQLVDINKIKSESNNGIDLLSKQLLCSLTYLIWTINPLMSRSFFLQSKLVKVIIL